MANALAIAIDLQNKASASLQSLAKELGSLDDAGGKAGRGLKQADDAADRAGKSADAAKGHFGGLSSALGGLATVAGGIGLAKLPGLFGGMLQGAADDEAATIRLQTTLKNLGGDIAGNTKAVNDRIAAGQKLGFSDDEIRDSFGFLAEATNDSGEALNRQRIAMDFARGAHISLEAASKILGKTSEENTNTLKKYGIEVAAGASETDVLAGVQARFAGQSEAFADSTAGKWAQFKIRLSEAGETIGYALLPVMTQLGDLLLTKVAPAMETAVNAVGPLAAEWLPRLIDGARNLQGPLEAVGGALLTSAGWLIEHDELLRAAGVGIATVLVVAFLAWAVAAGAAAVATLIAAAPVIALGLVVAALGAGIYLLITHWDDIVAKYPAVGAAFDAIKAAVQAAVSFIVDHWPQVQAALEATITWIAGAFMTGFGLLQDYVITPVNAAILFVEDHWGQIQTAIEKAITWIDGTFQTGWGAIEKYVTTPIDNAIDWVERNIGRVLKPIQDIIDLAKKAIEWIGKIPSMPSLPGFGGSGDNVDILHPPRATGDANWMGGMALVGERGPELAILPGGTTIIPNHLLAQLPHFANGGTTPQWSGGPGNWSWTVPQYQVTTPGLSGGGAGTDSQGRVPWDGTGDPPPGPWYGVGHAAGQAGAGGWWGLGQGGITPTWHRNAAGGWEFSVDPAAAAEYLSHHYGEGGAPGAGGWSDWRLPAWAQRDTSNAQQYGEADWASAWGGYGSYAEAMAGQQPIINRSGESNVKGADVHVHIHSSFPPTEEHAAAIARELGPHVRSQLRDLDSRSF